MKVSSADYAAVPVTSKDYSWRSHEIT